MSERGRIESIKRQSTIHDGVSTRRETALSLRETRRNELLAKRRLERCGDDQVGGTDTGSGFSDAELPQDVDQCIGLISGSDIGQICLGLAGLRRLFADNEKTELEFVQRPGALATLIGLLQGQYSPKAQLEAAWCLTSITAGTTDLASAVVENGGLTVMAPLLGGSDVSLITQVMWAIGNIAGDIAELRDAVLDTHVVPYIVRILHDDTLPIATHQITTWVVSNLCRGHPKPRPDLILPLIAPLGHQLLSHNVEILMNAAWSLSFIAGGDSSQIQHILDSGCVPRIIQLSLHRSIKVASPCLRVLGNMTYGPEEHTQYLLDNGVTDALYAIIHGDKPSLVKDGVWVLSNIAAGTMTQVDAIIDAGLIRRAIQLLVSPQKEIRQEAVWAIANSSCDASQRGIIEMIKEGAVEELIHFLANCQAHSKDRTNTILVALEGLTNLLRMGNTTDANGQEINFAFARCEAANGYEVLEDLRSHVSGSVFSMAESMLAEFWGDDEETEGIE